MAFNDLVVHRKCINPLNVRALFLFIFFNGTLLLDPSYEFFYQAEDYPVVKYLRQPVYFEVELMQSDPHLELILENCWVTLHEDRTSLPSWDVIVDR